MRHKVYGKHLGRTKNQRTALFKSLVRSIFLYQKIQTTDSKAKAVKGTIDKIINQAKTPSTRRLVAQFITEKQVREKLIKEIVPSLSDRNSGYTRIVKLGRRLGDGAMMVEMSLVEDKVKNTAPEGVKEKPKRAVKKSTKA